MKNRESTLALLIDVVQSASALVQKEIQFVRAEVKYKINRAAMAMVLLLAAAVLFMVAFDLVAEALVDALQDAGMSTLWSVVIVAACFAVVGLFLALKGMRDLKPSQLAPSRSTEHIRKTAETLRRSRDES